MKKREIKEFIEDNGTLISSKMKPNINQMATSKMTTDQHVTASRQGMVWMNYRRFYGEDNETLPYTKEADKWENDPEQFFKFLKSKGKQKEFKKYFVKKTDKKDVKSVLKEAGKMKMEKLVEDLLTKKRESDDLVKKNVEDKPNIDQLEEKYPAIMKKITALSEDIKSTFSESEYDIIIDYITQIINS
jgi:hypothetical protein